MREHGIEPNVITYSVAISACGKGSKWERALELLSEMRERRIDPNAITYSAAISACEKGSQWEFALELLCEMRERRITPDVITYSAAISACEKGSQWERALELLSEMEQRGIEADAITYNAAISACEKGSQWERALALMSEMRERGLKPNVITYDALIIACHNAGAETHAQRMYRESLDCGLRSHWVEGSKLDLHDLSVAVAKTAVAIVLEDIQSSQCSRLPPGNDLVIITGRGKRSVNGVLLLGPAILDMLAQPAYAVLGAAADPNNDGCVLVSAACLLEWAPLASKSARAHGNTATDDGCFSGLTAAELKDLLRHRGLPVSGNKPELVRRLVEHTNGA
jgi:pentatricopeptide repeat protein